MRNKQEVNEGTGDPNNITSSSSSTPTSDGDLYTTPDHLKVCRTLILLIFHIFFILLTLVPSFLGGVQST